jgi:glutathione synthase/RimK-type ligase-like ATP-grasp enzyme
MPMASAIVIFDTAETPAEYFLADNEYRASYLRLAELAARRNVDLRFVIGASQYEQGVFKSSWKYDQNTLVPVSGAFRAGIVFARIRTHLLEAEHRVNALFLEQLCRDKYLTYQTFPQLVKKTVVVTPTTLSNVDELGGEAVVLKPRFGANGRDVQLVRKTDLTPAMVDSKEFIAQELIDSSDGIPGLIAQRHEMRMYILNGEVQSVYLRLPAPDSFLSNISQGATVKLLELADLPASVHQLKDQVDALFIGIQPRLYTIDLMFESGRPWVVELNDLPGLPDVAVQPLTDNFLTAVLDMLVAAAN